MPNAVAAVCSTFAPKVRTSGVGRKSYASAGIRSAVAFNSRSERANWFCNWVSRVRSRSLAPTVARPAPGPARQRRERTAARSEMPAWRLPPRRNPAMAMPCRLNRSSILAIYIDTLQESGPRDSGIPIVRNRTSADAARRRLLRDARRRFGHRELSVDRVPGGTVDQSHAGPPERKTKFVAGSFVIVDGC